ncbi:MAG: phage major capsid protein [Mycobacteriaceae bacterium]|nr:phage major capsid protein [Mycobacteriaceae bacterium]
MNRAVAVFHLKTISDDQRIVEGVATTPTTDRMGDVIEPKGARFTLPLPLLWQHKADEPIGQVISADITPGGIRIRAQIASGIQRIDEAWSLIKNGLVRGLSIGFRPIESTPLKNGGVHFTAWDWFELSAVTVPANADASIAVIKRYAATGGPVHVDTGATVSLRGVPVAGKTGAEAAQTRSHRPVISVAGATLPKGTAFTRYAMALAAAKGDAFRAQQIVQRNAHWMSTTPEVLSVLKNGVAVGDTVTTAWAEELVPYQNMASEFVEYLRPLTLVGRIAGLRQVPFNVKMPRQTAGTVGSWVGEAAKKPVGALAFDTVQLRFTKVAKIVVISDELARFSTPSAEALVRADLAAGLTQAIDEAFIDYNNSGTTDIKPAAISNGAHNSAASGTSAADFRVDMRTALDDLIGNNIPLSGLAIATTPTLAVSLSLMLNPLGQPEFPSITAEGGSLMGMPVYTSQSVPSDTLIVFKPSDILIADDGGASVDVSREATVLMDDGEGEPGTTSINLWEQNAVGIRAERYINWVRRRDESVYYLTNAQYGS